MSIRRIQVAYLMAAARWLAAEWWEHDFSRMPAGALRQARDRKARSIAISFLHLVFDGVRDEEKLSISVRSRSLDPLSVTLETAWLDFLPGGRVEGWRSGDVSPAFTLPEKLEFTS